MSTQLYMMTEHSPFMMGFVYVTEKENCVVIDGGRPEDMEELLALVGDRRVEAWILTHPHLDHITGFVSLAREGRLPELGKVYCAFPSVEFARRFEPQEAWTLEEFLAAKPLFESKLVTVRPGMEIKVDELNIRFLWVGGEKNGAVRPGLAINESSLVCRVTGDGLRSVLFLGDLGPESGRDLLAAYADGLKSDIVQMAHHGHSGVTEEVYRAIRPEACLWCAPEWLWNEEDVMFEPDSYGTVHQRKWMECLGVTENYISKDGEQEIPLQKAVP